MARRKVTSAPDKNTAEYKALMAIVGAYDMLKNAERDLKDAKATALQEAKAALKEVDESIQDSRDVSPEELPLKVSIIITCWHAYKETKDTNKSILEEKSSSVKKAKEALETTIKDSRQGKLDFEGDAATPPVNAVVTDGDQAQAQA